MDVAHLTSAGPVTQEPEMNPYHPPQPAVTAGEQESSPKPQTQQHYEQTAEAKPAE